MAQQVRGRVLTHRMAHRAMRNGQLQMIMAFLDLQVPEGTVLLLTDIENTLALRGEGHLSDMVLAKFEELKAQGVRYVILRTNKKYKATGGSGDFSRMVVQLEQIFGEGNVVLRQPEKVWLPIWAVGKWPRKPWRATFRGDRNVIQGKLIAEHKTPLSVSEMLAVGDKLRFDVLRPLLMGWNVALVNPMGDDGKGDKYAQIRRIEGWTLGRLGLKRP